VIAAGRLRAAPALVALAVVVAALRAHALSAPLWMDEGISIGIGSHPLGEIPTVLRQDGSPPLYYLVLHGWMAVFGSSPTATHVLSLSFFALAVPAAVWAVWAPFGARAGLLAGALVALDPFTAYYADDARMYTLVLLLAILATGSFVRAFVLRSRAHVAFFALLLAALLYTHNWALFYAAAAAVAFAGLLAFEPHGNLLRDGALAFGGAALLYAPWLPTLAYQAAHTGAPWSVEPGQSALSAGLRDMWSGALPETIVLLVAGAGAIAIVARGSGPQRRAALAILAIGILTLGLAFAWSQVGSPAWADRYLTIVAAPVLLLAGAALGRARLLGFAAVAAAVALSWHGRPSDTTLAHKSNVAQVARALGPRLPAGSLVVTTQPEQVPALRYYLGTHVRYVTPFGRVRDPGVMDWRDALPRLSAARFAAVMAPVLRGLRSGTRLLFVGPTVARADTRWSRRIMADTRVWCRALRRRLRVLASAAPQRSSASTVAGLLLAKGVQTP
jgi:mannosyltransferase